MDPSTPSAPPDMDPKSGFCRRTRTFHTLRPPVPLPPHSQPLSIATYVFSLLHSHPTTTSTSLAFIDAATGHSISHSAFHSQVLSLASALLSPPFSLSKGQLALLLSPSSIQIPVLYFALLRIGVLVCPSNPVSTPQEISHQYKLTNPSIAFATSSTSHLLPPGSNSILLDSPRFHSLLQNRANPRALDIQIHQSDPAAVLFSSGTTGLVKAVVLSHGNFIALIAVMKARMDEEERRDAPAVCLFPVPLFHVFGFSFVIRALALGETAVLMDRFDFVKMLQAIERYRVNYIPVSPPLVVAMVKSPLVAKHDLSSLEVVGCGGAPLGRDVAERFAGRFPNVEIAQGYGLTESTAAAAATVGEEESRVYGSAGRLSALLEGKIVDPSTGDLLEPGQRGELWLRGPTVMQGYLGDTEATASTIDAEGWLKTGDLCYFDHDGFLFIVDRLKELIKYKAYQVAPAELEHILHSHPEILDVAVIPYPHEEAGQIPMACVVRQPGSSLDEKQVIDFVAKQVAPYKKIRRVSFIDAIPKTSAGKILRRELINSAVSGSISKL